MQIMTPIVKLLRLCDGEKPAMGKIYDKMFMISQRLEESSISWAPKAKEAFDKRWEYLHSFMHGAGYALDPEFMRFTNKWDEAVTNGVQEIIERMCLRDVLMSASNPTAARQSITADSDEVVKRVAACELELSTYQQQEGVFSKCKVLLNAKAMTPAAWWDLYGKHLPILSGVAKAVLAQVVCASAAERNWSVYGRIKPKERSRINHAKVRPPRLTLPACS